MSIADVAKAAGVSRATVSRVMNNRPGVSTEVVKSVRAAMKALNYTPAPLERRPGRRAPVVKLLQPNIAVVLLDDLYRYAPGVFTQHLEGMQSEAADRGFGLQFVHSSDPKLLRQMLARAPVAGAILLGRRASPEVARALESVPSMWLNSHHEAGGDAVLAGNEQVARIAAEYLLGRGHRRLAFISLMSRYPAHCARAEAFQQFGAASGATVELLLDDPQETTGHNCVQLPSLLSRMHELIGQLAALSPRPTGIFVPNDMMTAMAYVALQKHGIRPGPDVDVVSCNNEIAYLLGLDPPPATIDIGAEMMGRRCVEQLLRRMRYPEESRQVQIAVSPMLVLPQTWQSPPVHPPS